MDGIYEGMLSVDGTYEGVLSQDDICEGMLCGNVVEGEVVRENECFLLGCVCFCKCMIHQGG